MTILDQALNLAEEGFYVFPIARNAKTPAHKGWQQEATRDEDELHELFNNQRGFNLGIFCGKYGRGEALVVVDVDTKPGKNGATTMQNLDILGFDFPPTREYRTATGGRHLVYWNETPVSGGANKLGEHVDLKSFGGYIVAEGSTIDGKPYTAANDLPIHRCPQWIIDRAGKPLDRSGIQAAITTYDTDQTLQRASQYIRDVAPKAHSGGRNHIAFKIAAHLRDLGVSQPQAYAFMLQWDHTKCKPALDFEEIEHVTNSAYTYAALPAGNASPDATFEAVPYDPKTDDERAPGKPKLYRLYPSQIAPQLDFHPLIEDYLDQDAVSILYGASNSGKTFVALDIAYHIASGTPWNGHRVTQGAVAYLAAEGGRSALNRIEALKLKHGDNDFPLALIPCQLNLFDNIPDAKAFDKLLNMIEAEAEGGPIRLIIIDTLSRVLSGGNENDSVDMSLLVANITALKERFKCHVLIVHHSGKDAAKGARGHSLLRAAVDTELEIADNTITTTKQRDMEFAKPQGFELEAVTLGTTAWGKNITSCTIAYVDAQARDAFSKDENRLQPRDLIAYLALQNYQPQTRRDIGEHKNVVDQKTWAKCCKDFDWALVPDGTPWPESDDGFRKAFLRSRDRLSAFNRVREIEDKQWVILKTGQGVPDGTT